MLFARGPEKLRARRCGRGEGCLRYGWGMADAGLRTGVFVMQAQATLSHTRPPASRLNRGAQLGSSPHNPSHLPAPSPPRCNILTRS